MGIFQLKLKGSVRGDRPVIESPQCLTIGSIIMDSYMTTASLEQHSYRPSSQCNVALHCILFNQNAIICSMV